MLDSMRSIAHCTALVVTFVCARAAFAQPPLPPQAGAPQTYTIFIRGQAIGAEDVTVRRTADGWILSSTGRLGPPLNIVTRQFEMRYDAQWHPIELTIDAAVNAEPMRLHTTFKDTSAVNEITQRGQTTTKTDPVAADTIVIPNPFFAATEALAQRLSATTPPAQFRAYVAPQVEISIRVKAVTEERIQVGSQSMPTRRYSITFDNPTGPFDGEVSVDAGGHLLRLQIPTQMIEVARQDIASVASRIEKVTRPNDETVSVPANGFVLATTISKPSNATGRLPAVVLVAGSGATDRDEVVAGIPIFGQLANALADAGFLIARYDKRGVGQSGGRLEASTLADYADDLRAVVKFVASRKDVDARRIAVIGHSEGGAVGLIAASKDDRIAALVTLGAFASRGLDLVLEQQQHMLARSKLTDAEKQTATDFQRRLMTAVISGEGWEGIPPEVRRRVDTPWYRSFLLFDPSVTIKDVKQPLLIVQGELDSQAPPHHGSDLLALAKARKGTRVADLASMSGVNHLMVAAVTGEVDEYGTLKEKKISPTVVTAIRDWLERTLRARS
jgi:pimeloyl-ACP methyl ester carboxylesterase